MSLEISNVRLGLATNSSSTHSIVFFKKPRTKDTPPTYIDYGWDDFTLVSKGLKRDYLSTILHQSMANLAGPEIASVVTEAWLGTVPSRSIDHQSMFTLPVNWDGKGIDVAFFKALKEFVLDEHVAILGGNDNSDGHPLRDQGVEFFEPSSWYGGHVARYDEKYNFWTLFGRENGTKFRFRFGPGAEIVKSSMPELVDIKITDFCSFDCEFCYQGSTAQGKHADVTEVEKLAHALSEGRVFEVAIGGGEPTLHPHFKRILRTFRDCGIVPNFTTNRIDWLSDESKAKEILDMAGGVGVSVTGDLVKIRKLNAYCEAFGYDRRRFALHYVMGVEDLEGFSRLLDEVQKYKGFRILLLGFKSHGRGAEMTPKDYSKWVSILLAHQSTYCTVGIDTALAASSQKALKAADVPSWMYSIKEGDFSMYIDAVEGTVAPSSYCHKKLVHKLTKHDNAEAQLQELKELFAKLPDEASYPTAHGDKRIVEI